LSELKLKGETRDGINKKKGKQGTELTKKENSLELTELNLKGGTRNKLN
jgi:hypothetical protein